MADEYVEKITFDDPVEEAPASAPEEAPVEDFKIEERDQHGELPAEEPALDPEPENPEGEADEGVETPDETEGGDGGGDQENDGGEGADVGEGGESEGGEVDPEGAEGGEEGEGGKEEGGKEEEPPAERRVVKVKGEEDRFWDEIPEDEKVEEYQKGRHSHRRWTEAKQMYDAATEVMGGMKPDKALDSLSQWFTRWTNGSPSQARDLLRDKVVEWLEGVVAEEELPEGERVRLQMQRDLDAANERAERAEADRKARQKADAEAQRLERANEAYYAALRAKNIPEDDPYAVEVNRTLTALFKEGYEITEEVANDAAARWAAHRKRVVEQSLGSLSYDEIEAARPDVAEEASKRATANLRARSTKRGPKAPPPDGTPTRTRRSRSAASTKQPDHVDRFEDILPK